MVDRSRLPLGRGYIALPYDCTNFSEPQIPEIPAWLRFVGVEKHVLLGWMYIVVEGPGLPLWQIGTAPLKFDSFDVMDIWVTLECRRRG